MCSELNTKTRWRSTTKTRAFIKGHYKILNTHTILKYTTIRFYIVEQRRGEKRNKTGTEQHTERAAQSNAERNRVSVELNVVCSNMRAKKYLCIYLYKYCV